MTHRRLVAVDAVWALLLATAAVIVITYSRLAPEELYNVSEEGLALGLGRALVFLNYPVSLVAIPDRLARGRSDRVAAGAVGGWGGDGTVRGYGVAGRGRPARSGCEAGERPTGDRESRSRSSSACGRHGSGSGGCRWIQSAW